MINFFQALILAAGVGHIWREYFYRTQIINALGLLLIENNLQNIFLIKWKIPLHFPTIVK